MKKVDIIVEARLASKRLPKKVMLKALNRPLLDLMIERLKQINFVKSIIIATTTNKEDDEIANLASKNGVKFFRGSEKDVLGRVARAVKENMTDIVVQITGDNPLVDKKVIENMIEFYISNQNKYDFISNDIGVYNTEFKQEFPLGLCAKVFDSSLLYEIEEITNNPIDREHVVNYILKNHKKYKIYNFKAEKKYCRPDLRFTLDYLEDYKLIKSIYENLYEKNNNFSAIDIFEFLDKNPNIKKLNSHCKQQTYNY
jgi:spore coat polysaccharide biosynthesis protein SpsF